MIIVWEQTFVYDVSEKIKQKTEQRSPDKKKHAKLKIMEPFRMYTQDNTGKQCDQFVICFEDLEIPVFFGVTNAL